MYFRKKLLLTEENMMKRFLTLLAIASIVSGAVWAQMDDWEYGKPKSPFDWNFNAVGTISTEARYSAGLFGSDVDDYIDVRWHDPEIGNFVFLGGYPDNGESVNVTDVLTPAPLTISFGYGKTLGSNYLGIYYGGHLADASGIGWEEDKKSGSSSTATWNNRMAVLFGIANMGLRLDVILDSARMDAQIFDGAIADIDTLGEDEDNPYGSGSVALSWGMSFGALSPYATVGYKFPNQLVMTNAGDKKADKTATYSTGAQLGVEGGINYEFNETSSLDASLGFGLIFPDSFSGDTKDVLGEDPYNVGGGWGLDLNASFTKAIVMGNESIGTTTIKISPNLGVTFVNESFTSTQKGDDEELPALNMFTLSPGIDLGIQYQYQKIALYSGVGLTCLTWSLYGFSGGKEENKDTAWEFTGIEWNDEKFTQAGARLGLGMTFSPVENLVFGAGISAFLSNFFGFDLKKMQFTPGTLPSTGSHTNVLGNVTLDLTVSYKFTSAPKEPKEKKAKGKVATEEADAEAE
jgi:hypothetical protein